MFKTNWRVNKRLTLNLGLRWDGVPHTYEANNRMGNFYANLYDPSKAALLNPDGTINPASPGLGTSPNSILAGVSALPKTVFEFLARMAYLRIGRQSLGELRSAYWVSRTIWLGDGKTVLRGGSGIMYERIQGNDMYDAGPIFRSACRSTLQVQWNSTIRGCLWYWNGGYSADQSRQYHRAESAKL